MRVYTADDVDNYTNNYNRLVDEIEALLKFMKSYRDKSSEEYLCMCKSLEILYRIQINANLKSAIFQNKKLVFNENGSVSWVAI